MGMQVPSAKGGPTAEMNVVPLIDVLLVLLIIFMVITPLVPQGLEARLPQPAEDPAVAAPPDRAVVVAVGAGGTLRVNQQTCTWETLGPLLEEVFQTRAERVAFLLGEDQVEFAEVARALDLMRGSGIEQVGLLPPGFAAAR